MSLTERFQQLQCRILGHDGKNHTTICVHKECKLQQRIGCDLCHELHKSHRHSLLSIAEVQRSLENLKLNEADPFYQRLSKIIDEFQELSQKKLEQLVQQLRNILSDIMEIRILKENITSYEELKLAVKQLIEVTYLKDGDIQFQILKESEIYPKFHSVLTQYLNEINNYWNNNTGYIIPISEKQNPSIQQQIIVQQNQVPQQILQQLHQFQFSKQFCSQKITCISPRKVKKSDNSNEDDIACLEKPLCLDKKQSFNFKIITLKGFIGIGIAIFQQVELNKFLFEASECTGHGVFMVLNNRLVYNNSSSDHNYKYGSIKMEQGLRYKLTFDPFNKDGQFSIQALDQNNEIYSMPMDIDKELSYHVFAYIGQKDGEVELMDVS